MLARVILLSVFLVLAGCSFPGPASDGPQAAGQTSAVVATPQGGAPQSATDTPVPEPTAVPRVLTVCVAQEPANLFVYSGRSLVKNHLLEAIYDGPIDSIGFGYQPVILEKLPDLADGDAVIEPVPVGEGDWVVNDAGDLVPLTRQQVVRPFGCTQPECAIAWDGAPLEMAQLSATFTLLPGLQWSDGAPLTAGDSVFSYGLARQCQTDRGPCGGAGLASGNPETAERTAEYLAIDERTVRWSGVPGFLDPDYRTNFFIPLPEHQLGQLALEDLLQADASFLPLGWGPYLLDRWVPGDHIRLLKNPNYFRAGEGLPGFDMLVFRNIGPQAERNLSALLSGTCDVLDQTAGEAWLGDEFSNLLERDESGDLEAHVTPGLVWEFASFGIQPLSFDDGVQLGADPPALFNDVRTRQAIAQCMDRQRMIETVFHSQSAVPDVFLPAEHPLFNPDVSRYAYDPESGAGLLQQTGWVDDDGDPETPRVARGIPYVVDGTPLAFTYLVSDAEQRRGAAEILAESLAGCGVQVDLEFVDAEQLYAAGPGGTLFGRRYEMSQLAWLTGVKPPCDLFTSGEVPGPPQGSWIPFGFLEARPFEKGWGGLNAAGWLNAEYDRACRAAQEALPGQPGYLESHATAQKIFAAELPAIPLYFHLQLAVARPDLCGLALDPVAWSELWNIEAFEVGEACP